MTDAPRADASFDAHSSPSSRIKRIQCVCSLFRPFILLVFLFVRILFSFKNVAFRPILYLILWSINIFNTYYWPTHSNGKFIVLRIPKSDIFIFSMSIVDRLWSSNRGWLGAPKRASNNYLVLSPKGRPLNYRSLTGMAIRLCIGSFTGQKILISVNKCVFFHVNCLH